MNRRPFRHLPLALLALAALALTACNSIPKDLAGLVVRVDGIRALAEQPGKAELMVTMRCYNETIRPIGIRSMDVTLALNGINLGRVQAAKPLATQSMSSNTQDVAFTISDSATLARVKAALRSGTVSYELQTKLTVMAADDELQSKSTSTGSVDVNPAALGVN